MLFPSSLLVLSSLLTTALARPLPYSRASLSRVKRAALVSNYADFQISGGVGGDAKAEAEAVFVDPFAGVDLASVSAEDIKTLQTMREDAEAAEADFNTAIEAAGGTKTPEGISLQVGKIKNKVLKLTGFQQVLVIQAAQGKDTAAKFAVEQKKLDNNINLDIVSTGVASTPVAGSTEAPIAAVVEEVAADEEAATSETAVEDEAVVEEGVTETETAAATGSFALQDYADFQISSGSAGNAEAEAAAVFIGKPCSTTTSRSLHLVAELPTHLDSNSPFPDLNAVTAQELADMKTMRSAAEAAESDFNDAIDAAGGNKTPAGAALQVGKIKNKVLKLTGLSQIIRFEIAQGDGDAAKLAIEDKKLANNIATDVSKAGDASTPVV